LGTANFVWGEIMSWTTQDAENLRRCADALEMIVSQLTAAGYVVKIKKAK